MLRRRLIFQIVGLVLPLAWSVAASAAAPTRIEDPAAFVRTVYDRLAKDDNYAPPEDIYSPRLKALWAGEVRDAHGEVGRIDFDFWINAQDGKPRNVQIQTQPVEGRRDRQIVTAKFGFQDGPEKETIRFYFERTAGVWKLDEVISAAAGTQGAWTLSTILKYGWTD